MMANMLMASPVVYKTYELLQIGLLIGKTKFQHIAMKIDIRPMTSRYETDSNELPFSFRNLPARNPKMTEAMAGTVLSNHSGSKGMF